MIYNLRFRLLLAFAVVFIVAVGTVYFFVNRTAGEQIKKLEQSSDQARVMRIGNLLSFYYANNRGWDGVQSTLQTVARVESAHLVLVDTSGNVVADSQDSFTGHTYNSSRGYPIIFGPPPPPPPPQNSPVPPERVLTTDTGIPQMGSPVIGTFYILSGSSSTGLAQKINSLLLFGGLIAAGIAIIIVYVLTRQISRPIQALTSAARQLGKGDLSQRVKLRGKGDIAELSETFNAMAGDFERNEAVRRNFIADSAHELRTPISTIHGYLEAIRDGVIEPNARTINLLYEETTQLTRLLKELQDISLSDAGQLKLNRQLESIPELVKYAASISIQAESKGITLKTDVHDDLPPVRIDRNRILEVLRNLIDNAITHTEKGGTITISAWRENSRIKLAITDTGEGIPPEDLNNIFERFYRVDKSRTRATGGHGLGLTIVKKFVEAHGGTVEVESEPGRGSKFTVILPIT